MTTKEILIAARKLIEKPEHWTQRAFATNEIGNPTIPGARTAASWCAEGAVRRVGGDCLATYVVRDLERACGWQGVLTFNDSHTHAEVLAAFDRAIESQP